MKDCKTKRFNRIKWDNIISIKEASELTGRRKNTLVQNINNGVFVEGVDCKKIGSIWIIDKRVLERYYSLNDESKE